MRIVYFSLGHTPDLLVQLETSILRSAALMPEGSTIHLYCEDETPYKNWPVRIEKRTPAEYTAWKGTHNFFWRIKIQLLLEMAKTYADEPILYLDGDTLALDLQGVHTLLQEANCMHLNEGELASLKTKTERRMRDELVGKAAHGILFHERMPMFNAGAVGLMAGQEEAIELALRLCDTWLDWQITPRLIEQLALSVALHYCQPLSECRSLIGHYWSTKDWWTPYLKAWLEEHNALDVKDKINAIQALDTDRYPFWAKRSNTARRLRKLLGL